MGRARRHPSCDARSSQCQTAQSSSFPARCCARVVRLFASHRRRSPPRARGGRSAGRRPALQFSRAGNARRHACEAWPSRATGRPPLGAPPWRCRPSTRLRPPALLPAPARRLHAAPGICAGPQVPGVPSAVTSRGRRHLPPPPSGSSPEDAPHERDFARIARMHNVVKWRSHKVVKKSWRAGRAACHRPESRIGFARGIGRFFIASATEHPFKSRGLSAG
jgi:hypothetical protein